MLPFFLELILSRIFEGFLQHFLNRTFRRKCIRCFLSHVRFIKAASQKPRTYELHRKPFFEIISIICSFGNWRDYRSVEATRRVLLGLVRRVGQEIRYPFCYLPSRQTL